jgi:large subunit ribosomal protein L30
MKTETLQKKKGKLLIKLIRSPYGFAKDQIGTVRALGLKKINQIKEVNDDAVNKGMLFKVKHLVKIL